MPEEEDELAPAKAGGASGEAPAEDTPDTAAPDVAAPEPGPMTVTTMPMLAEGYIDRLERLDRLDKLDARDRRELLETGRPGQDAFLLLAKALEAKARALSISVSDRPGAADAVERWLSSQLGGERDLEGPWQWRVRERAAVTPGP